MIITTNTTVVSSSIFLVALTCLVMLNVLIEPLCF